jgi:centractin
MDALSHQPIVVDNGGATIKAGFAGEDKPKVTVQNIVGRIKHRRVMAGGSLEGDT